MNRYIKDTEIANMYQNAACVVYPYISATQSGVLSLAYYFETPILASDVPFFKDSILQSETGVLFENGNLIDLKDKLFQLLKCKYSSSLKKGRSYYNLNYDGMAIRNRLLEIYKSIS